MQILLWVLCFVSLLLAFVVGLGVSLGLINLWGLGLVAFFVLVLYTASTVLDKHYSDSVTFQTLTHLHLQPRHWGFSFCAYPKHSAEGFKRSARALDTTKPPTMPQTQQRACRGLQPLCWGFLLYEEDVESTPTILKVRVSDHSEVLESEELYLTLA